MKIRIFAYSIPETLNLTNWSGIYQDILIKCDVIIKI